MPDLTMLITVRVPEDEASADGDPAPVAKAIVRAYNERHGRPRLRLPMKFVAARWVG